MGTAKINIPISFQQLVEAIKQLNPKERSELSELIWDENASIPMEHQDLVNARIKEVHENPSIMLDWDEASKTLTS